MKYVYDGFLTEQTAKYVKHMGQQYEYVVEASELPPTWNEWQQAGLKDYSRTEKNCGGQEYTRTTKLYGLVRNGEKSLFVFFKSEPEMRGFLKDFPDFVVNDKPFKTAF